MIERFKSIFLIILLVMAVVLTYLNTLQPFFVEPQKTGEQSGVSMRSVVRPSAIFYSHGDGVYTRIYDKKSNQAIWDIFSERLPEIFDGAEVVRQVSKGEYAEAFLRRSFLLYLPGLSRELLVSDSELGSYPFYDEIVLCDNAIYARASEGYYVLESEEAVSIEPAVGVVLGTKTESYRRIADRFSIAEVLGTSADDINYYPVPYTNMASVTKSSVRAEFNINESSAVNEIAKNILGERLDFAQMYEDASKSIVVLHDRGRKSITFQPDGELIFKNLPGNSERLGFEEALSAVLRLAAVSGGVPEGLYLLSCEIGADGEYSFDFGYNLGGHRVVCCGANEYVGIRAVVAGDSVSELRRFILLPENVYPPEQIQYFPADQCISRNIEVFSKFWDYPESERFFRICAEIEAINMVFCSSGYVIEPAWEICVGGDTYLFDAFSGEPIKGERRR